MEQFLEFVQRLRAERYEMFLTRLIKGNVPCGLFWPFAASKRCDEIVSSLNSWNINLVGVYTPDEYADTFETSVKPVSQLKNSGNPPPVMFLLTDSWANGFHNFFKKLGIKTVGFRDLNIARMTYDVYFNRLQLLYDTYNSLNDDESRKTYLSDILGIVSARLDLFRYTDSPQYMLAGYLPKKGDVFIDGGSFDGATAVDFAAMGCNVYSFELDADNYEKGKSNAQKYNFQLENYGLGERKQTIHYEPAATASRIAADGAKEAKIIDIDTYLRQKELSQVDFIKMDIEGAEMSALRGAAATILRYKPKLAICTYHKLEDKWTILSYIRSLRPDYQFDLRHHLTVDYGFTEEQNAIYEKYELPMQYPAAGEEVLYAR